MKRKVFILLTTLLFWVALTAREGKKMYIMKDGKATHEIAVSDIDSIVFENPQEPCYCFMDTLKGEWSWIKAYGGFGGNVTDNEFKSIVKILNQNEDASIDYEVFVEDTLFYKSSFQMEIKYAGNEKIAKIKLPHWMPSLWGEPVPILDWRIRFSDLLNKPSENTLYFWNGGMDDYFYYYQRIREEE